MGCMVFGGLGASPRSFGPKPRGQSHLGRRGVQRGGGRGMGPPPHDRFLTLTVGRRILALFWDRFGIMFARLECLTVPTTSAASGLSPT